VRLRYARRHASSRQLYARVMQPRFSAYAMRGTAARMECAVHCAAWRVQPSRRHEYFEEAMIFPCICRAENARVRRAMARVTSGAVRKDDMLHEAMPPHTQSARDSSGAVPASRDTERFAHFKRRAPKSAQRRAGSHELPRTSQQHAP